MFPLRKYFSIASLFGILAVVIALSLHYKDVSLDILKDQEARSNASLATAFSNSLWSTYKSFIERAASYSKPQILADPDYGHLDKDVRTMMKGLNIVKIKIYSLNGNTIYSTEPKQIGANKSSSKGFLSGKSGNIASELTFRNQFYSLEGVVVDRNLISSYLPVRKNKNAPVEAVFELYSDVTNLVLKLESTQNKLVGGVLLILAILYLFLYAIVHRAHKTILQQENERQKHAQEIYYHAYHDSLTGLPNRKGFLERLDESTKRSNRNNKPFAVMFFDLDRFKVINDSLGHDVGDQLLCIAANRIKESVREIDMVFRMGGDEFTILTDSLNSIDDASQIARRITENIAKPFALDTHEIIVTTSIGIAIYPKDDREMDKLVKDADAAMYKAKELGRNQYQFYTDDLNSRSLERLAIETGLRKALENEEFELHYQPKATTDGNAIVGMEALLRWNHPEWGLLAPDRFLGYLEDTGLIIPVGEWVIRQACHDNKQWQNEGMTPISVSVNLSSAQFRSDMLVTQIERILSETGLEAKYLELELTESLLVENTSFTIRTLQQIKDLGVFISIDDFGTGYSSLNYLRSFPIDFIKIDRSFIKDLDTNNKDAAITSAIATLAHSLDMEIIAEGVENNEQLDFLKEQGCQQVQGFLIGKPIPIEQMKQEWNKTLSSNNDKKMDDNKKSA